MGLSGWVAMFVALIALHSNPELRRRNPAWSWHWIPWAILIGMMAYSLTNVSYAMIGDENLERFVYVRHNEWLPSVVSRENSLPLIVQFSGSLALAWSVLATIESRRLIRVLLFWVFVNGGVLAILGAVLDLLKVKGPLNLFQAVNPSFFSSFSYHNHWAAFGILIIAVGGGLFFRLHKLPYRSRKQTQKMALFGCLGFFVMLSFLLVESRSALVFASIYLVLFGYTVLSIYLKRSGQKKMLLIGSVLAIVLLGYLSIEIAKDRLELVAEKVDDTLTSLVDDEKEIDEFRFGASLSICADLIEEKPVFGWGFGSYRYAMIMYAPAYLGKGVIAQYAHCDWLQGVSDLGAVGFLCFAYPFVVAALRYRGRGIVGNWLRIGGLLVLVFAIWDFPLSNPSVMAHFLVLFVCSTCMMRRRERRILRAI